MELRHNFTINALTDSNDFMRQIKALSSQSLVQDAIRNAPARMARERNLNEIVLDDMMDTFARIVSNVENPDVVPLSIFQWMKYERTGEHLSEAEARKDLTGRIEGLKNGTKENDVPDFMTVLFPVTPKEPFMHIAKRWEHFFDKVSQLVASEDSFQAQMAYHTHMGDLSKSVEKMLATRTSTSTALVPVETAGQGGPDKGGPSNKDGKPAKGERKGKDGEEKEDDDLAQIQEKLTALHIPKPIKDEIWKIYRNTKRMNAQSSEYSVNIRRLETIVELPWGQPRDTNTNIAEAKAIMDSEHFGLEKVKEKIVQTLAVEKRTGAPSGKIILLVGPPGVGKTSIAQSLAKATGREYVRVALGGVHRETDIRGHSSTFVGALPGRIISELKKCESNNPLIVLDEVDKLGQHSGNGDPTAALLEVLDPAQNHAFRDDYLGVEFDLSKVLFVCTANDLSTIPGPLRDRMQIVALPSYTSEEKLEIATRYILPKQMKKTGLTKKDLEITPEALESLIVKHTAEAGVRKLEQKINEICSKVVVSLEMGKTGKTVVEPEHLVDLVGPARGERNKIAEVDQVGVVNGLAYSSIGGSVLPIEVSLAPTKGFRMTPSGNLGKVMSESASVAESLIRSRAPEFGISDKCFEDVEIRIHAPEGATPKDGPSAGAAFTTAIISSLTNIPVKRDVAMTGEINLRGEVTAIGGLPEKLEGALRAGVKTVLIPAQNLQDLNEVSKAIRDKLAIKAVKNIDEVLKEALAEPVVPLIEEPVAPAAPVAAEPVAPAPFFTRLRKAWDVMNGNGSNDNATDVPQTVAPKATVTNRRQAGARTETSTPN